MKTASKYKMVCPECRAVVITSRPEFMIWERCPSCGYHTWDQYDIIMAEEHDAGPDGHGRRFEQRGN